MHEGSAAEIEECVEKVLIFAYLPDTEGSP